MPNTETGSAKNTANVTKLKTAIQSFATGYNPSAVEIKLPAIITLESNLITTMSSLHTAETDYKKAINARQLAFEGMSLLSSRMESTLEGSGVTKKEITDGKAMKKKITGVRAKPIKEKTVNGTTPVLTVPTGTVDLNSSVEQVEHHSVSQMSFDSRTENFKKYVTYLGSITKYNPNENDLKITTLNTYTTGLLTLNTNVNSTYDTLHAIRATRDKYLFADVTGAHDIVQQVKNYVAGAFGGKKSSQYKLISKILIKK